MIDYFCIEKLKRGAVQDLEVWEEVNLGSDHRAVRIILQISTAKRASGQKEKGRKAKIMKGWRPQDEEIYMKKLGCGIRVFMYRAGG